MKTFAALMGLLISAATLAASDTDILQNQPRYSPFAYILDYLARNPGHPECYIDEGYLNFTQDWYLDPGIQPTPETGTTFQGGGRDSSGLGGMTNPVVIGDRKVSFYAGRRNAFVGPTWTDGGLSLPFPRNLYPPTAGELPDSGLGNVNWYDQILLDAGARLGRGEDVAIDLFMFEIGASNPFIDNLFRLVKYGFVDCPEPACPGYADRHPVAISKRPEARPPASAFAGHLTVHLYYQFQQACTHSGACPTRTEAYLNGPITSGNPDYQMTVKKVWQGFTRSHLSGNPRVPATPQDMHLKVGVVTSGRQVRLYVATSNLDMPDQGSGRKWQAGTIIDTTPDDGLYRLYQREFASIANDGYLSQYNLGFAHTLSNSHFDHGVEPTTETIAGSGIAAFLFPLNTAKGTP